MKYEVIVGNVGTAHRGNNRREAEKHYREYVEISKFGTGRAGNEPVTLFAMGEIVKEFLPEQDYEEY